MRVGMISEKYWLVSVEISSVDENATCFVRLGDVKDKIKEILSEVGFDKYVDEYVGSIGYTDYTIQCSGKQEAICIASYLDLKLGKASSDYRNEWRVETNAMVAGPYVDFVDTEGYADMQTCDDFDCVYGCYE